MSYYYDVPDYPKRKKRKNPVPRILLLLLLISFFFGVKQYIKDEYGSFGHFVEEKTGYDYISLIMDKDDGVLSLLPENIRNLFPDYNPKNAGSEVTGYTGSDAAGPADASSGKDTGSDASASNGSAVDSSEVSIFEQHHLPDSFTQAQKEIYTEACRQLDAGQMSITVYGSSDDIKTAVTAIGYAPEYFWLTGSAELTIYTGSTTIRFDSRYSDIETRKSQIEQVVNRIFASMPEDESDLEKLRYLHDWLTDHLVYTDNADDSDQDIYGAFVLGKCVCAGYAKSFAFLARLCGFSADLLIGTATNNAGETGDHAWNTVTLNGTVYYFDVTWDDRDDGRNYYSWFGLSESNFRSTHFVNDIY